MILEPTGDHAGAEPLEFSFEIDGAKAAVEPGDVPTHPVWSVDTAKLTPGRHLLTVHGEGADGSQDVRYEPPTRAAGVDALHHDRQAKATLVCQVHEVPEIHNASSQPVEFQGQ